MGEVDVLLAVPTVLSVVTLFAALCSGIYMYVRHRRDLRQLQPFAQMQFTTCVAASIACMGSLVDVFGLVDKEDSSSSVCLFESYTSSFGELGVVLWTTMSCVYFYVHLMQPKWSSADLESRFMWISHRVVWPMTAFLTFLPGILGTYGMNTDANGEHWCWFKPGYSVWEWVQFYGWLVLYAVVSCVTFVVCMIRIVYIIRLQGWVPDIALYVRLAFQFLGLIIVFVPDLFVVLLDEHGDGSIYVGSRGAEFLWKCEGLVVGLLFFGNSKVREIIDCYKCCCHQQQQLLNRHLQQLTNIQSHPPPAHQQEGQNDPLPPEPLHEEVYSNDANTDVMFQRPPAPALLLFSPQTQ